MNRFSHLVTMSKKHALFTVNCPRIWLNCRCLQLIVQVRRYGKKLLHDRYTR